jgi:Flp pilus assembly protein TadB
VDGATWLSLGAAAAAAAALVPRPPAGFPPAMNPRTQPRAPDGWLRRWRALWATLAGLVGLTWVAGWAGVVMAAAAAAAVWRWAGRAEPSGVRRARARARAELPHLVILFGAALKAGAAPGPALELVCHAVPGPAADALEAATARLALGGDPATVWAELSRDPELAALGRCLARAHATGSPVAEAVARLGQELAADRRALAQDRARAVGVKAAVPLGLCLLPAFLLLGIVPVVAGLAEVLVGG